MGPIQGTLTSGVSLRASGADPQGTAEHALVIPMEGQES